ncbi:membrane protein [Croceivirga lutea]|uniref:sulfite exporter TauE/SafE family protein n=1 Tax=Croceivirga lutea TaxID=1775167 RepID=UPI001639744E|nr:sulfite exporter TauE/SafE family protein [Croceivirga lutea]GGG35474.1 membrane protein [Croceivirga lutea]
MVASALVLGLLGSLHCLGMCGPIAFMLPLDKSNNTKKIFQLSLYHLGRIFSYALMGLAFGLVGKGLQLFGFQQKLSIVIGVFMILLVLIPSRYVSKFSITKPVYTIIGKVKSKLGNELKKRTPDTFLTIGVLNGFLPCGLVYMALLGAIAMGNAVSGSLYMAVFGLGTIPLMTTAVYFSTLFTPKTKAKFRKLVPVFVVLVGVLFIIRGMGLGIPYLSPAAPSTVDMASSAIECH